jgi:ABC-type glycerol-3-phosphate transport system permease component
LQNASESVARPPFLSLANCTAEYVRRCKPLRYSVLSLTASGFLHREVGQLITASLAAYAFSFLTFPGRNAIFYVFLSTMMIPWEVTIIPNYFTIRELNWLDTYQGLAVPFLATAFGTFLLRQAFMTLPRELTSRPGSTVAAFRFF